MNENLFKLVKKEPLTVCFDAILPNDLCWFRGHFKKQPLLPGVIQLLWAQKLATQYLFTKEHSLIGVPTVKFMKPLIPSDKIRLCLTLQCLNDKKTVKFEYLSQDGDSFTLSSSGKLNYKDQDCE